MPTKKQIGKQLAEQRRAERRAQARRRALEADSQRRAKHEQRAAGRLTSVEARRLKTHGERLVRRIFEACSTPLPTGCRPSIDAFSQRAGFPVLLQAVRLEYPTESDLKWLVWDDDCRTWPPYRRMMSLMNAHPDRPIALAVLYDRRQKLVKEYREFETRTPLTLPDLVLLNFECQFSTFHGCVDPDGPPVMCGALEDFIRSLRHEYPDWKLQAARQALIDNNIQKASW